MQMTTTDPIFNQWVKFLNMKTSNVTTNAFVGARWSITQMDAVRNFWQTPSPSEPESVLSTFVSSIWNQNIWLDYLQGILKDCEFKKNGYLVKLSLLIGTLKRQKPLAKFQFSQCRGCDDFELRELLWKSGYLFCPDRGGFVPVWQETLREISLAMVWDGRNGNPGEGTGNVAVQANVW